MPLKMDAIRIDQDLLLAIVFIVRSALWESILQWREPVCNSFSSQIAQLIVLKL